MRKLFGFSLVLAVAACAQDRSAPMAPPITPAVGSPLVPAADGPFVAGRLLIRFHGNAPVGALLSPRRAAILREVLQGIKMLQVPVGSELAIAASLQRTGWVEFVEPDYLRTVGIPCGSASGDCTPPDDTYFGYKWDLHNDGTINNSTGAQLATTPKVDADIDWLEAYDQLGDFTGSARIGIMDTGIHASHPDLAGRVVAQRDFYNNDAIANDDDGHGTHVAGITAAHGNNGQGVMGVAYGSNVKLVVAKVCGRYGCPVSAIADGIRWAVDNGANVLNLSLGGNFGSSTERTALQYARAHDVLPFCAAGNDGGAVDYPGAFPECVAVSATDWGDGLASYSSFGSQVELAAPGGDFENGSGYSYVLSTYWSRANPSGYAFLAGTSMATPQATGLAALLHALGMTDDDAKLARMKATADDLGAAGVDNKFGSGRINVFRAINGSAPPLPPPPLPPPPPSAITLSVATRKAGNKWFADLTWSGATGASVDVYRNGSIRATTANDGAHSDALGPKPRGTYKYKVCQTGTTTCSNESSVKF
jgi:subtilisin family serine protease